MTQHYLVALTVAVEADNSAEAYNAVVGRLEAPDSPFAFCENVRLAQYLAVLVRTEQPTSMSDLDIARRRDDPCGAPRVNPWKDPPTSMSDLDVAVRSDPRARCPSCGGQGCAKCQWDAIPFD